MKKVKLFCIPCAGGTAVSYLKWKNYLHYMIELCPIELRNRGKRLSEQAYEDIDEAVNDVFNSIKYSITDRDYALFGHSMGGLIVYELYYKLYNYKIPLPKNIFIFGKEPPSIPYSGKIYHKLNDEDFKESIMNIGGTPNEVIENEEVYNFFAPIIKGDFRITERYIYNQKETLMDCNIVVINGREDKISSNNLDEYKKYTNKKCSIHWIKGGHFSLYENPLETLRIINNSLI